MKFKVNFLILIVVDFSTPPHTHSHACAHIYTHMYMKYKIRKSAHNSLAGFRPYVLVRAVDCGWYYIVLFFIVLYFIICIYECIYWGLMVLSIPDNVPNKMKPIFFYEYTCP